MIYLSSNKRVILNLFQDLTRSGALYNHEILKQVQGDGYCVALDQYRESVAA